MKKKCFLFIFIISFIVFSLDHISIRANQEYFNLDYDRFVLVKPSIEEKKLEDKVEDKDYIEVKNSKTYKNKYYKGTLKIDGTDFNEPLYQYKNNDYFLTHDGNGNRKSSGATYLDYRINKNSRKILIYGHNNDNLSLPFSILENYNDIDYYYDNSYLTLIIDGEELNYEIFSVFVETENWDYMSLDFDSSSWVKHLGYLKEKSIYDTGIDVSEDDKILILQTCSKNKIYSKYKNKYMLVVAKLV